MKFLLDHDVPDDLSFLLIQLGHEVTLLRQALPSESPDDLVLGLCHDLGCVLITCNRDDFPRFAQLKPHHGNIIVIRRRTRAAERAALFGLIERAGDSGITANINFA
jgi:hypothetical protein